MITLEEIFDVNPFSLMVNLPCRQAGLPDMDLQLAAAAVEGGAEAILFSLNNLSDLAEIKSKFEAIRVQTSIPLGISLPPLGKSLKKDLKALLEQVNFVETSIKDLSKVNKIKNPDKIVRLSEDCSMEKLLELGQEGADIVNASIIPKSRLKKKLTVGDLQQYISVVISAGLPVIIPSELTIQLSEVAILWDTGAKGILLTPATIGTTPKSILETTRKYRIAVDDLSE